MFAGPLKLYPILTVALFNKTSALITWGCLPAMRIKFALYFPPLSLRQCFVSLACQKIKKLAHTTKTETCFQMNGNDAR